MVVCKGYRFKFSFCSSGQASRIYPCQNQSTGETEVSIFRVNRRDCSSHAPSNQYISGCRFHLGFTGIDYFVTNSWGL